MAKWFIPPNFIFISSLRLGRPSISPDVRAFWDLYQTQVIGLVLYDGLFACH